MPVPHPAESRRAAESSLPGPEAQGGSSSRRWRRIFVVYLVLLLLSHGWRLWQGRTVEPEPAPDQHAVQLAEVELAEGQEEGRRRIVTTGRQIRMAYFEWPPQASPDAPTVLLVHGSPGSGSNFAGLGPLLAARGFRVVAPDLPGFGASSPKIADYSIRAHADYCLRLLDALGIDSVHAVGFSLGGGVVLEMWQEDSRRGQYRQGGLGRVRSLTLLAAVGVQEMELLGQYGINHAIHGAQLALFRWIQEGVPHFGLFDRTHVHLSYARNFFDSDQRPLRAILERYDGPMLILHGENDVLVPYAAALEHRRIVPQSELVASEANHFMVFRDPRALAEPLADFVQRAEAGTATVRATAEPERLAAVEDEPLQLPAAAGPTLVVWILLLMVATLVSEDLTCIAAGLLVARGSLGFGPAVLACGLGIFVGDLGLYLVGRLGRPFLGHAPFRWFVDPAGLRRSARWFERRGGVVILISRFLPGTRIPTYVSAGLLGMHPLRFALYLLVPVALWTPLLVMLAVTLGERFFDTFEVFQAQALPAFVGLLVCVWICLALGRAVFTWRGRRRLVGRWKRWRQWEFWPLWLFYPPVVVYLVGLALRHRSATLFTAANPGIPAGGGFIGESKSQILESIRDPRVAAWQRLPDGVSRQQRLAAVDAFLDEHGLDEHGLDEHGLDEHGLDEHGGLPVVLKPDVGQRGLGVVVARDRSAIEAFLEADAGPAIVQRYVGGAELGVFWVRLPGEESGRIFSITDKRLPAVAGDGVSTLERLVLEDPRAVAMAPTYLARFADRLDEVPAAGESVRLVELGTHCRGAVFLDGAPYRTPELEAAVDAIARSFDGFYFGRFDLRAPSYDHFRRGESIQVLELNGVTSEATHIYDPRNSLFDAYRVLFEQWRLAFEIGRRNRRAGHEPTSVRELVRLALEFRREKGVSK